MVLLLYSFGRSVGRCASFYTLALANESQDQASKNIDFHDHFQLKANLQNQIFQFADHSRNVSVCNFELSKRIGEIVDVILHLTNAKNTVI